MLVLAYFSSIIESYMARGEKNEQKALKIEGQAECRARRKRVCQLFCCIYLGTHIVFTLMYKICVAKSPSSKEFILFESIL